jgi:hypothetical protein
MCTPIAAIDLFPNVRYVLSVTENSLGKAEGEEAWKNLRDSPERY